MSYVILPRLRPRRRQHEELQALRRAVTGVWDWGGGGYQDWAIEHAPVIERARVALEREG